MDISGINNNNIQFQIENAKSKSATGDFASTLKKAYNAKDEQQLKKVCKDFEKIFLSMMYKEMRATVIKSDLVDDSAGGDMFKEMLDDKIAEEIADGPGVGLADMMYKNLSKTMKASYKSEGEAKNDKVEQKVENNK
jgi:flagellar protein FlgJ